MDEDDILTAYHEAGHAVVGFALGGTVESIQIGGEHDVVGVRQFGDCRIAWRSTVQSDRIHLQRELLTILAGPAAEIVYAGRSLDLEMLKTWKQDLDLAWILAEKMTPRLHEKQQLMSEALQQLQSIIRTEKCWSAVAAVADALLAHEFLEESEVEEVLRFWMERPY